MSYKALPDRVLVSDFQKGERKVNGIILPNDDGKSHGIRSRWARVYSVGEEITDVNEGEWVLIQHGRWTRGVDVIHDGEEITLWQVDYPTGVLAISDEPYETFDGESLVVADKLHR